jgi:hypothetical protein
MGWVKGSFACPNSVLAFGPGSAANPTACVGESHDKASLRYAVMEFQIARTILSMPKLSWTLAALGQGADSHACRFGGERRTAAPCMEAF